jgi:hypothetical protein
MIGVSRVNADVGRVAADLAPEVFMCKATKSGWSWQNDIAAEFKGANPGS